MRDGGRTREELDRQRDPRFRGIAGALRRFAVDVTSKALWRLLGVELGGERERVLAEVFPGVGFYARPPTSGRPEAIVANLGDAGHPVVIATRDEATRVAVAGGLAADETAVFNSKVALYLKADGTLEARTVGGTAVKLPTLADVQALADAFNAHLHVASGALTSGPVEGPLPGTPIVAPDPEGTEAFKAE